MNELHNNKSEFKLTDQAPLLEIPTDNPASTHTLHADEMKKSRLSRTRFVCKLHPRRKREREPSKILP